MIVLSLLAHRDEAEFFCAGTMMRLSQEHQWEVHLATVATSCPGLLAGARYHSLDEPLIFYNERTLEKATRLIRELQPRIVLTHSPKSGLVDHEMTSLIARAASSALTPHLYYCDALEGKDCLGRPVNPRICIDISEYTAQKAALLAPPAGESMLVWARRRGQLIDAEAAEGYRQHLGPGYPQDDLLGELLGAWPAADY